MYLQAFLRLTVLVCVFIHSNTVVRAADIAVPATGNFQAALDAAQPGDTITLQAGAMYTGNFVLKNKGTSEAWIEIRSSALASLPGPGQRVTIADALRMPKIATPDAGPALKTAPGAHHYRFVGIEFRPALSTYVYDVIVFGAEETQLS